MGGTLTWSFAADGRLHWDVDSEDFRARQPKGMDCTWRLDRTVTPNRLDVVTPDGETFLAIAEFAPDGALLVDCNMPGSSCRPDRPEDFTAETWTLRRSGKAGR